MSTTPTPTSAARDAGHSQTVVTYQSPRGNRLSVCTRCLAADVRMPRDWDGQEYCTVSHGRHHGSCDLEHVCNVLPPATRATRPVCSRVFALKTPKTRKPVLQICKFCGDWVNLDEEGNTYANGTAAHEECHDSNEFERANAADFRD